MIYSTSYLWNSSGNNVFEWDLDGIFTGTGKVSVS